MKNKPQIGYNHEAKQFEQDGKPLTYDEALEIFNAGSSDWSNQAYWTMAQIVMGRAQSPV